MGVIISVSADKIIQDVCHKVCITCKHCPVCAHKDDYWAAQMIFAKEVMNETNLPDLFSVVCKHYTQLPIKDPEEVHYPYVSP